MEDEILLRELLMNYEYTNVEYELLNHYINSFIFAKLKIHYKVKLLENKIKRSLNERNI